jgi:quercetin dioxygenase-like cupin family protein
MTVQMFRQAADVESIGVLGSVMAVLATADETRGAYEVVLVESGPGGDVVPHRHPWEEMYFVIDGTLEVQVGRRVEVMSAGSLVTLPARCLHAFQVTSDTARFLHVSIGRGAVDAFRDLHASLPAEPTLDDAPALFEVLARHGIELQLPEGDPLAELAA